MGRSVVRRVVAVLFLVVLATGCAKRLDTVGLQADLKNGIEIQQQVAHVTVTCPPDVPVGQGRSFACTAVADSGSTFTIEIKQIDDNGNVTWEITDVTQ